MVTSPTRPFTGKEFLESLRDGREIWIYGERIEDVTTHAPGLPQSRAHAGAALRRAARVGPAGLAHVSDRHGLREAVTARKYFVLVDQGWSDWDLEVHGGLWSRARIKVATENHGGERRVLRIKCALRGSRFASLCTVGAVTIAVLGVKLGFLPLVLTGAAVVMAVAMVRESLTLGRMLHATLQTVARGARLRYAPRLQDQPAEVQ